MRDIDSRMDLESALGSLTEVERITILWLYWGCKTQQELAALLGVTQSRVSRLHRKAIHKLQSELI